MTTQLDHQPPPHADDLYTYRAEVVRIVDGDTVILDIDLGCYMWLRGERCRLVGIDAPEPHTETRAAGDASTEWLRSLLAGTDQVLIRTHKDEKGKWGRWLVEIWRQDSDGQYTMNVNKQMIDDGHAVPYEE